MSDLTRAYTLYPTRLLYLTRGIGRLAALGRQIEYGKDHMIARGEDVPSACWLVLRGKVMAYDESKDGNLRIYSFMEAGSVLLEANMLMRKPALVNFKTTAPTSLVRIEREDLIRAMAEDRELMMDVIESISYKFLSTSDQLRECYNHSVSWRLCNLFLIYADRHGAAYDGKVLIQEKLTQQTLAGMLSVNRITVVRALKELKDLGFIEQINGYYCIRDVRSLRDHMDLID